MKPSKAGLEEQEQIHKIRITLSSKNVKNLEKGLSFCLSSVLFNFCPFLYFYLFLIGTNCFLLARDAFVQQFYHVPIFSCLKTKTNLIAGGGYLLVYIELWRNVCAYNMKPLQDISNKFGLLYPNCLLNLHDCSGFYELHCVQFQFYLIAV